MANNQKIPGLNFSAPSNTKIEVDFVEVGPFKEDGLLAELNRFAGANLKSLVRINTYLFVHEESWSQGVEKLSLGLPFVDRVVHQATVNSSLAERLGINADFVLVSMLRPGTSDAEGEVALDQALARLQQKRQPSDQGFLLQQYFVTASLSDQQRVEVCNFLSNPELCSHNILSFSDYKAGAVLPLPLVDLENSSRVEIIPISEMDAEQLEKLNTARSLAALPEELKQFQSMYVDPEFLAKRESLGLSAGCTDVEIETWFGLRSEHCFHKEFSARVFLNSDQLDPIFEKAAAEGLLIKQTDGSYVLEDGIFKAFIQKPAQQIFAALEKRGCNWIASMFSDNAGVAYYDENFMFAVKAETHNSPSNKEPVQGAKTGLNGNFRDIMGTMRGTFDILAGGFLYCTGDPNYKGWLPSGVKHPYVLLRGITRGVREAGNEMQVPTLWGHVLIDPRYIAKCLVFCSAVGWSPVKQGAIDYREKNPSVGDLVMIAGQAVGVDGIHGATESSLSASAQISLGHVQADFSFIQARVKEFMLEASRQGLFTAVTDCGAMGLGSSSHEIARDTGGLDMDLAKHPLKYQGIWPWQINCSETQDRMLLVVAPENRSRVLSLARRFDVSVSELGTLTESGYVVLRYNDAVVGLIDINKLFSKEPRKQMQARWMGLPVVDKAKAFSVANEIRRRDFSQLVDLLFMEPDLASKEWFFRQKDFSVKGGTILAPLTGLDLAVDSDASMQKPLDTEGYDMGALAYSWGVTAKQTDYDPYFAAQNAFVEAIAKLLALGATLPDFTKARWDSWAVCGNYCQPNSDSETALFPEVAKHNLASLVREGLGVREAVLKLGIPVISGKDSMKCSCVYSVPRDFNLADVPAELRAHVHHDHEKSKIEIHDPETYLVTAAAKVADYRKAVDTAFKKAGDLIFVLGASKAHFAGSQIASALQKAEGYTKIADAEVPVVNFAQFIKSARLLEQLIDEELLASSAALHAGGLITALFKGAWAGGLGAEIEFVSDHFSEPSGVSLSWAEFMLTETPGRFLFTIDPADFERVSELAGELPLYCIGRVGAHPSVAIKTDKGGLFLDLKRYREDYRKEFAFAAGSITND